MEADTWAAWIRSVTGNTALQEEVVWSWNARRCAAGLTEGKSKSAQKWEWLKLEMVEHLPVAVFVIEVEGTLADLRDLRRWFRVFGFFMEFSVGTVDQKGRQKAGVWELHCGCGKQSCGEDHGIQAAS